MRIKGSRTKFGKVKHFSHADLDGVGCGVLTKVVYGDTVDIEFISADRSSEIICNWLQKDAINYDSLIISDLSVNEAVADMIENSKFNAVLLDHHETAVGLNTRSWCTVEDTIDNCGTTLTYAYLQSLDLEPEVRTRLESYADFVYNVYHYDIWLWEKYGEVKPVELNRLLGILGRSRFLDRFLDSPSVEWSTDEQALLILDSERKDRYVYAKKFQYFEMSINGLKFGVVPAELYISELANELLKEHTDVEAIAVVTLGTSISFRSREGKLDISKFAPLCGGGGHDRSGGAPITEDDMKSMIVKYFVNKGLLCNLNN